MTRSRRRRGRRAAAGSVGGVIRRGPAEEVNVIPRLIIESRVTTVKNPGPAAYAVVIFDTETEEEEPPISAAIGDSTSVAVEYHGLIAGLRAAAKLGLGEPVEVRIVAEAVIDQMTGRLPIQKPHLKDLADRATQIAATFPSVVFTKTSTEATERVYQLACEALSRDRHDARALAEEEAAAGKPETTHTRRVAGRRRPRTKPRKAANPKRLGATRSAALLSELTGLDVEASDVEELVATGLIHIVGDHRGHPLYEVAALRELAAGGQGQAVLTDLVAARTR